jgi:putative ABC transport system permease protein
MLRVALTMLTGDRAKYVGLLLGIAFTAFLVTFAASYFAGFMTRGFALVTENPQADVWVMDPAVSSVEQTTNMAAASLYRVRSVAGGGDCSAARTRHRGSSLSERAISEFPGHRRR